MPGVRERLDKIFKDFMEGSPKGLVLTLYSMLRLRARGEEASLDAISREGKKVARSTRGVIDWGVDEDEYETRVSDLVRELESMGIIERSDGAYRVREDLVDELYRRVGILFSLRCC
ncbi:MAG: hypothetical protein GSR85_10485 [Desulfurococcales archaeon]|nr:hypothetical protein [Desulfurococcales archaeon]